MNEPGDSPNEPPLHRVEDGTAPRSLTELFFAFAWMALHGFGGILPFAQSELVERRRWLTQGEFLEMLAFGQLMPGPNVINMSIMVGDRYFGWRGSVVALGGMIILPGFLVVGLAASYSEIANYPVARNALTGMTAAACGLILGTAVKLGRGNQVKGRWLVFCAAAFVLIGLLRWPLISVLAVLGPLALAMAWWQEAKR